MGHGHVTPNPDGTKARCGGPAICAECSREAASLGVAYSLQPAIDLAREVAHHSTTVTHCCAWCPLEVRDRAACAHNAVVNYGTERERKKMADLKDAVTRYRPAMDAHFAALKDEDPAALRAEVERLTRELDECKRRAVAGDYERPAPTAMPGEPERRE